MRRFAILVTVLALVGTLVATVAPSAVAQDSCPPAGGVDRSFDPDLGEIAPEDDVAITGGGWGHGVGMSQYGAQGAARLGCTHEQILTTYYRGVRVEPFQMPTEVRVGFLDPSVQSTNGGVASITNRGTDPVTWRLEGCDPARYPDDPDRCTPPDALPAGATWRVYSDASGVYHVLNGDGAEVWRGADKDSVLIADHDGTVVTIDVPGLKRTVRWGATEFDSYAETAQDGRGKLFVVQEIDGTDQHSAMERYLWGLAEVPSSWPTASLEAQAIAARSYARIRTDIPKERCRCHLYATVRDQHYSGWDKEAADATVDNGDGEAPWKRAVNDTAGRVMRYTDRDGNTSVADGFYSSSHGGWSDAAADVWGSDVPYLQAVDTSNWEARSDNPRQRWTNGFTDEELASRFGFAEFIELSIENRGEGGRPTVRDVNGDSKAPDGAVATGRDSAGTVVHRWYSGEQLRSKLGVFSGLIHVHPLSDVPFTRLIDQQEQNRIGTSVAMSRYGWGEGAATIVVARADDPADALAGATLAGKLDAPLLITYRDALHPAIRAEVERLGAKTAYLLGGEQALTPAVADGLEAAGVETLDRVAGPDRVGTAAAISDRLFSEDATTDAAYLVFSAPGDPRSWPDALAISGTAARRSAAGAPWPVLVTGKTLPDATSQELEQLGVTQVVLVGGPVVIPAEVETQLQEAGFQTRRLAGDNRYGTSVKVASEDGAPPGTLLTATGDAFPDGLGAGALAARLDVTLLLVPSATLADVSREWVDGLDWADAKLLVSGGSAAISDEVVTSLRAALEPEEGGS
ncbi:MAG: cell wall-binding repeat-containing protein [Actinobacteria bacterium]|nr:cell wall-binding repeat-containing protein [Actinomycetota bacterium]